MCIRDRNRCRRLRNIRQSNKGLRGGDTPLPKHVEEKLWDVGAGKAVPLRDGVDDLGPEAGQSSVAVEDVMDELFRNVTRYNPEFERETISRAFQLASSMHGDQLRASGESFILHPLGTALICAELRLDSATITAALLHDVVEDTDVGLDLIKEEFGEEVALLVDGVTKLTKMTFKSVEEQQAENYRKMIIAMAKDIRVILIKLADRLHNMRTLCYLGKEKQIQKAKETLEIYAPLAHRLGIESMRWELEDLAFSTLHPRKYAEIEKMVSQRRADREEYIEEARNYLSKELGKVKIKSEIVGRAKHFYSIYDKMTRKGKEFNEIYDLTALRVLVSTVKDCYGALGIIHSLWKPLPGRFKDYIAMPKFNMYQSLHTTVIGPQGKPLEIQIRTYDMNETAQFGIAAHWTYKERSEDGQSSETEKLQWLRQMMEWQSEAKDASEFMESLRVDLFTMKCTSSPQTGKSRAFLQTQLRWTSPTRSILMLEIVVWVPRPTDALFR